MALIVLSFNNISNSATKQNKDPCWKLEWGFNDLPISIISLPYSAGLFQEHGQVDLWLLY